MMVNHSTIYLYRLGRIASRRFSISPSYLVHMDQVASYDYMLWVPTVTDGTLLLNMMKQTSVTHDLFVAFCPTVGDFPAGRRVKTFPCGCQTTQIFELSGSGTKTDPYNQVSCAPLPMTGNNTLIPNWLDHEVVGGGHLGTITIQRFDAGLEMYQLFNSLDGRVIRIGRDCDQSAHVMAANHFSPKVIEMKGYDRL